MYMVDCLNPECDKRYRKGSTKERQGYCPECQTKRRKDGNNVNIGIQRQKKSYVKRLKKLEIKVEDMMTSNDMYLEALQGELSGIVDAKINEFSESFGPKFTPEFKELKKELMNKIVEVNTRSKRLDEKVDILSGKLNRHTTSVGSKFEWVKKSVDDNRIRIESISRMRAINRNLYEPPFELEEEVTVLPSKPKFTPIKIGSTILKEKAVENHTKSLKDIGEILLDAPSAMTTPQIHWLMNKSLAYEDVPSQATLLVTLKFGVHLGCLQRKGGRAKPQFKLSQKWKAQLLAEMNES